MLDQISPKTYPFIAACAVSATCIGLGVYTFIYLTPTVVKVAGVFAAFVGARALYNFNEKARSYSTQAEFEEHVWEIISSSFLDAVFYAAFESIRQLALEALKKIAAGTITA